MKKFFVFLMVGAITLSFSLSANSLERGWTRWSYDFEETHFYPFSSTRLVSLDDFEKRWTFPIRESYHALTGDINGDGFLEIVIGDGDIGACHALDYKGKELWQTSFTGRLQLLADVTGDGVLEIFLDKRIGNEGHIFILNGTGNLIKTIQVPVGYDGLAWPRAVGDFDNDGQIEIIAVVGAAYSANPRGTYIIDYSSGAIEWHYAAGPSGKLQGGDVDEDGKLELVYGGGSWHNGGYGCGVNNGATCTGDNAIWTICFNAEDGSEVFTLDYFADGQYRGFTEHILADPDQDGDKDIFSFEGHSQYYPGNLQIHQIDHHGNIVRTWHGEYIAATDAHSACGAVGDINNDGFEEIVFGFSSVESLRILDHELNLLANRAINSDAVAGSSYPDIFINDLNGDGYNEIIFGDFSLEQVRIFDKDLNELWSFSAGLNPKVTISDLDNDGINEIIVSGDSLYVLGILTPAEIICNAFLTPDKLNVMRCAEHSFKVHVYPCEPMDVSVGDTAEVYVDLDNNGNFDDYENYLAIVSSTDSDGNATDIAVKVYDVPLTAEIDPYVAIYSINNIPIVDTAGNSIDYLRLITFSPHKSATQSAIPNQVTLQQNHPNPFNPETIIKYSLPEATYVKLTIYNILGQKVITLVDEYQQAGAKEVFWDARDENGNEVGSGMYFYKIKTSKYSEAKKMILMR